tara:strand:- start:46 stop:666 length:621 start_codon:yes stop_codon:yes gene_type:complete
MKSPNTLPLVTPMLGAGVLAVAGMTVATALEARDPKLQRERLRVFATGITGAALLLWPMLWRGLGLGLDSWPLLLAFLWPLLLVGFDLVNAPSRSRGTPMEETAREAELRALGDRLIGAVWSLGALLIVLRTTRNAAPAASGFSRDSARVVLVALLFVLVFVLPTADAPKQVNRMAIYQAQRCALHFACGLYAAGILLVVQKPRAQ